jgi:CPA2 family monovalent cation:H+ antiporter-2
VAFLIVRLLRYPVRTGLVVGAGLGQVGEFSFILAEQGRTLNLLPAEGASLIVAGALLSITLNPLLFWLTEPLERWLRPAREGARRAAALLNRPLDLAGSEPVGAGTGSGPSGP